MNKRLLIVSPISRDTAEARVDMMKPHSSTPNIISTIVLVVLLTLGILFRSFVLAEIIEPIALILWLIVCFFLSINPMIYWTGIILLVLFGGLRFITIQRKRSTKYQYEIPKETENRLDYWSSLLAQPSNDKTLRENLKNLLSSSGQNGYGLPFSSINPSEPGPKSLPENINAFLYPEKTRKEKRPGILFNWSYFTFQGWGRKRSKYLSKQYLDSIENVLTYLENNAELQNDQ